MAIKELLRKYLSALYKQAENYIEVNDKIIDKLMNYNKISIILISRDPEEYMSGHRSKTRIFLAIFTQFCFLITVSRFLLIALWLVSYEFLGILSIDSYKCFKLFSFNGILLIYQNCSRYALLVSNIV